MTMRLAMLLTVVTLLDGGRHAAAQQRDNPLVLVEKETGTSHASLIEERSGRYTLVVDYPWKAHQKPSVEVRLVVEGADDPTGARPLFFVKDYLKGDVTVNVYHYLDASAGVACGRVLTRKEIEFEIIGRRNSLGKPSVCIAQNIVPDDDPTPGAAAAYCLLDCWSLNQGLLNLDLPPKYFSKPGKLYVWFLRDGKVLWEEVEDWRGYKEGMTKHE